MPKEVDTSPVVSLASYAAAVASRFAFHPALYARWEGSDVLDVLHIPICIRITQVMSSEAAPALATPHPRTATNLTLAACKG